MSGLGLVAYNSSDESDDDCTERAKSKKIPTRTISGHISDDEFDYHSVPTNHSSLSAKTMAASHLFLSTGGLANATTEMDQMSRSSILSLSDLPAPKGNVSEALVEDDELEDEVKPKEIELVNAQRPPEKKRMPIKISVPVLEEIPMDEDESLGKKFVASQTKSGLFGLLPPPIHSAKKEINRPLIPHTLTKKPPAKSSSQPTASKGETQVPDSTSTQNSPSSTNSKITLNVAMYGSDSDDEDKVGSSNFFSLDSSFKSLTPQNDSNEDKSHSLLAEKHKKELSSDSTTEIEKNEKTLEESVNPEPEPGAVNDAPLDFGHRTISRQMWSSSSFSHCHLGAVGLIGPVSKDSGQEIYPASSSVQYNLADTEVVDDQYKNEVADDDLKQFMSEKEFQRLSGKRKRGQEEAITFVNAKVDDYVDPSELSKHLTEETEYVSHKSKDNMPTAQQKRKKQITYLAYQAKEKELELKNTWAQNRQTKRQTQSKYGF